MVGTFNILMFRHIKSGKETCRVRGEVTSKKLVSMVLKDSNRIRTSEADIGKQVPLNDGLQINNAGDWGEGKLSF